MRRFVTTLIAALSLFAISLGTATTAEAAVARMQIYSVVWDPAGRDTRANWHLNQEFVRIKNTSRVAINISGYLLHDRAGWSYRFPRTIVPAGQTVYVHTGKGTNRPAHRYWGRGNYVWNNTGDQATLRDYNGRHLDSCSWGDRYSWKRC
ncbi:lamin tail-like protein [Tamaricihabitans halophyticus]|uniref:Lamin tail-like protein n=1 Tax=Tamaricihabitans halophyticus TaxID=1262583 RepID=A0A4R2Q0G5_9PSEU|nr:lamin tail domain-containing protein [Tamaricihabitans halophyticus]TCP42073.1 lamin tail-like protein [Tamaricihabitans halophyticus]